MVLSPNIAISPSYDMSRSEGRPGVPSDNQRMVPVCTIQPQNFPIHTPAALALLADGSKALLASKSVLLLQSLVDRQSAVTVPRKHSNFDVSIARLNPTDNQHFLLAANLGIDLYEANNQSMELIHVNKKAHNRYINDLDWNYESRCLFATGSRNEIGFWDTRQGGIVQMKDLPVNIMGVSQLKWCKLDRNILASSQGNDVKIWDFRNLSQSINELTAVQTTNIHSLQWSSLENAILVAGSEDFSVKVLDLNSLLVFFTSLTNRAIDNSNSKKPAQNSSSTVEHKSIFDKNPVTKAKFAPFAKTFTTCDKVENVLRLYSYEEMDQYALQKFEAESCKIVDFEWTSFARKYQLISLSSDKKIRIWSPSKELFQRLNVKVDLEDVSVNADPRASAEYGFNSSATVAFGLNSQNLNTVAVASGVANDPDTATAIISSSPVNQTLSSSLGKQSAFPGVHEVLSISPHLDDINPLQYEDCHNYASPNKRIVLRLECMKLSNMIVVTVQSCLGIYSITFSIHLDQNSEITCSFETVTLKHLSSGGMSQRLDHQAIKHFIIQNLQLVFKGEKYLLEVANFRDNAQAMAVMIADAVLSAYSLAAVKNPQPKDKDAEKCKTIPYPKTSGGRFSAGRLVIFNQSMQQAKQYKILPPGEDKRKTPHNLADYYNSRNAAMKFTQISVICQEVPQIFIADRNLAREYKVFDEDLDRTEICEHNREVCAKAGKTELARMWDILSDVAVMMKQFDDGKPTVPPMSLFPLGRPLIESYIEYYLQLFDIQTVAMIVAVFYEESPSMHLDTSYMTNSTWNDKELSEMAENDFNFFVGEENLKPAQPIKKLSDRSLLKEYPQQFIRDDLFVGESRRGSDFFVCESPDDKRLQKYWATDYGDIRVQKAESGVCENSPAGVTAKEGSLENGNLHHQNRLHSIEDALCVVEDTRILSPNQTLRYNIFKSMYADILYRWELLMQRCEVVKKIDSQCFRNSKSSSDERSTLDDNDNCYKILFVPKAELVSLPSPKDPRYRMIKHSPSYQEPANNLNPIFEAFLSSNSSRARNSEPVVHRTLLKTSSKNQFKDEVPVDEVPANSQTVDANREKFLQFFCVVCREEVKGLFTCCFKCNHGGHPNHLREWFMSNEGASGNCPVCGIECQCAQMCHLGV